MTDDGTHDTEMLALAKRFFAAVTAGDMEAVRACYAPGATVWHNTDGVSQDVDENLRVLAWIARNVKDFHYEDVRRQATPTGFVEQHLTCGTSPGGAPFAIPACIVCTVIDGRVARVDEYIDSAQAARMAG
jgi:ketosteroid isomerase-like protein